MITRMRAWQRRTWHDRSQAARVELQSVIVWHASVWFFCLCWMVMPLVSAPHHAPLTLALQVLLVLVNAAQCAAADRALRPVLDHYLGRAVLPPRALWTPAGLFVLGLALAPVLVAVHVITPSTGKLALSAVLLPFGMLYGIAVSVRQFLRRAAVLGAVLMAASALIREDAADAVATAAIIAFGAGFSLLATRCGAWNLAVLWEAERSRGIEARLAVAEERLRFARDLHDVMGRNLAVIALKSELAVQLARRGRPEALEQMIEVQRIAQESQREVREVVRGYREADLEAELAGARGVLRAAGIDCTVSGSAAGLPAAVQSALAWVVREAATNVLRHGDAGRCAVSLRTTGEQVVLRVENDGAPDDGQGRGSGLMGLRERLSEVGGTLRAGPAEQGLFRLTAEVPLPRSADSPVVAEGMDGVAS
ncbi:sensor histidine kinase [Streptomyces sp. NPDC047022]|uniref:sensor histidine kinase n=1 Tax=Streptomyces sp. NPDC047022 TaxID=3155737 RepID=UPI0033E6A912